jgi:hypothetical protein
MTTTARDTTRFALTTKTQAPTDTKGTRIKASSPAGSTIIAYDYALSAGNNHAAAAKALADKLEWDGEMVGGSIGDGVMVWVSL